MASPITLHMCPDTLGRVQGGHHIADDRTRVGGAARLRTATERSF